MRCEKSSMPRSSFRTSRTTDGPLNCVVKLSESGCEVWNGEQFQTGDLFAIAKFTGLKPEQIRLNMLYAGGSFGRRASSASDCVLEAVSIAVALVRAGKPGIPVKMVWTREDDMKVLLPPDLRANVAGRPRCAGAIAAGQHRVVGQSILAGTAFESMMVKDGIDLTSVEGHRFAVRDSAHVRRAPSPSKAVPVLWWRSVGSTHTAFSTETFIDELAVAAARIRGIPRAMLAKHPRHLGVLELVQPSGMDKPPRRRRGENARGVACMSRSARCRQVAEVQSTRTTAQGRSGRVRGRLRDCRESGRDPGADGRGHRLRLSAALYGKITMRTASSSSPTSTTTGAADQRNAGGRSAHSIYRKAVGVASRRAVVAPAWPMHWPRRPASASDVAAVAGITKLGQTRISRQNLMDGNARERIRV